MTADIQALKNAVPFPELVSETHIIGRDGKVLCPAYSDTRPSCHVYPDGWKCFSCGAHGDVLDWLELVHNLSFTEATEALQRRAGMYPPVSERPVKVKKPAPTFKVVDENILEAHRRRAAQLDRVPLALKERGFNLNDLKRLGIAAYGPDAVLPITGPDGTTLALKKRFAEPYEGQRYRYVVPGHGTPAWCSPGFLDHDRLFLCEGELNGTICSLVCPEIGVMATAGTSGALHLEALRGRTVYVYADADATGQAARDEWASSALSAGAAKVFVLEAWSADACDFAGQSGRSALRGLLIRSLETAKAFDPTFTEQPPFNEHGSSSNKSPWLSQKSHLTNTSRTQIGTGWVNAKSPWGY